MDLEFLMDGQLRLSLMYCLKAQLLGYGYVDGIDLPRAKWMILVSFLLVYLFSQSCYQCTCSTAMANASVVMLPRH